MKTPESHAIPDGAVEKPSTLLTRLRGYFSGLAHPFTTIVDTTPQHELWRIIDGKGDTVRTERRVSHPDGSPEHNDIIPFPQPDTSLGEEVWDRR